MKDFLKKYGLLIIPAYTVLNGILGILQNVGFFFSKIEFLFAYLMAALLMALAIFLSAKAVSKTSKYAKPMLRNACMLAVASLVVGQIPNIIQGGIYISPITIIAVICVIANAVLQKKTIQPKKDAAPAAEIQASITPAAVEPKVETAAAPKAETVAVEPKVEAAAAPKAKTVAVAQESPAAAVEHTDEKLKGKVLFDTVEDVSGILLTVTDEGFRYVGKALPIGSARTKHVDEFVEYSKIIEFKKSLSVYNINANGYTFTIAVPKEDLEPILYIQQRYSKEQRKPHIMRCNICGQIYTYTFAEMDEQLKKMKTAAGSMAGATLTTLASSLLVGSVQSGNAQAQVNSAADKLDALSRCPNCRSTDATEITAEEAAEIRAASAAPVQAASSADELKKFKELLDSGIITQEEFDAKKKQLLGL